MSQDEDTLTAGGQQPETGADDGRDGGGTQHGTSAARPKTQGRVFTQSEVDAMIAKKAHQKIERARREAKEELCEQLGIEPDDFDSFKEKLGAVKTEETESRRYARQLKREQEARAEIERELETLRTERRDRIIAEAIDAAAGGATRAHVQDVIAVMRVRGSLGIDDDGNVTSNGKPIKQAVDELLKQSPHLLRPTVGAPGGGSLPPGERPATGRDGHDLLTKEGRMAFFREHNASIAGKG